MFYSWLHVILMQTTSASQLEVPLSVCDVSAISDAKTWEDVWFWAVSQLLSTSAAKQYGRNHTWFDWASQWLLCKTCSLSGPRGFSRDADSSYWGELLLFVVRPADTVMLCLESSKNPKRIKFRQCLIFQ